MKNGASVRVKAKSKIFTDKRFQSVMTLCERAVKKEAKKKKGDIEAIHKVCATHLYKLTSKAAITSNEQSPIWIERVVKKTKEQKSSKTLRQNLFSFEENLNIDSGMSVNLQKDLVWYVDGQLRGTSAQDIWISCVLKSGENTLCAWISFPLINEQFWIGSQQKLNIKRNPKLRLLAATKRGHKRKVVNIYIAPKQDFEKRGLDSWYQQLIQSSAQSLPSVYGITRVLLHQMDVFIAPSLSLPCAYALEHIFSAENGLQVGALCHMEKEYVSRHQSIVAANNVSYVTHVHERYGTFCEKMIAKIGSVTDSDKRWLVAKEIGIQQFLKKYPQAKLEECAVTTSKKHVISSFVRNASVCEPVTFDHAQSYHVRATCHGFTGLLTGTYPLEKNEIDVVLEACESALQQASFVNATPVENISSLAPCFRKSGHFGESQVLQLKNMGTWTKSTIEVLKAHHKKNFQPQVLQIESRVSVVVEEKLQLFIDGVKQNISENYFLVNDRVTSQDGDEKRQYSARFRENRFLSVEQLALLHKKQLETASSWAIKLLKADYAPTKLKYDYLAIDADLLGLILHEAIGHASEGDLIATGQSGFGEDGQITRSQLGVNWLNVFIDGTLDNCGRVYVDSEGVVPHRKMIIHKGKMVDAIHTRETARLMGGTVDGCARNESTQHPPINRMTSIWLQSTKKMPDVTLVPGDRIDAIGPESLLKSLQKIPSIKKKSKILFLSGWKGGTASCSNLEFRADVAKIFYLQQGKQPKLMREANFTGIATECLKSVVAALGPHLCRSIGVCGKDGQGVPTSDGGPSIILLKKSRFISVIGSGNEE